MQSLPRGLSLLGPQHSDRIPAEATCAEAFDLIKQTNEGWCQAELHPIAATATLAKPGEDLGAGEELLHEAIQLAQVQGAKWWELRAP